MQRAGPAWAWDAYKLSEPLILRQWYPELRLGPAARLARAAAREHVHQRQAPLPPHPPTQA